MNKTESETTQLIEELKQQDLKKKEMKRLNMVGLILPENRYRY